MVSLQISDPETGQMRWFDLPAVPRVGEGLFFDSPDGLKVRRTVDDVTYMQHSNAEWSIVVHMSRHD